MARPRKSREQHELTGMIDKHAEYKEWGKGETQAVTSYPVCPAEFKLMRTRRAWSQTVNYLVNNRLMTEGDFLLLKSLFYWYETWCRLSDKYDKMLKDNEEEGRDKVFKEMSTAYSKWEHIAIEFGLSPRARRQVEALTESKAEVSYQDKFGVKEWNGSDDI